MSRWHLGQGVKKMCIVTANITQNTTQQPWHDAVWCPPRPLPPPTAVGRPFRCNAPPCHIVGNAAYAQFCFSCAGGELRLLRGDPSKKRERRARAGPLMIAILARRGHNNQPNFGVIDGGGYWGGRVTAAGRREVAWWRPFGRRNIRQKIRERGMGPWP